MKGQRIGDYYDRTGQKYRPEDNAYTKYTYQVRALACPVVLYSRLTCPVSLGNDLSEEMFS